MSPDDPHVPGRRVEDETTVEANAADVYRAWAEPDELVRWFVDRSGGRVEPGGSILWAWDAYDVEQELEVVEAEAGRRLVLRTVWGGRLTVLEVTLEPLPGGTRLRLIESGFGEGADWDGEYEGTRSGWTHSLAHLKVYLERHPGRDRETLDLLQPVAFRAKDLLAATRTTEGLAKWLGRAEGDLGGVGDRVRVDLQGGGRLTGRVISMTDWETGVTWDEIEGTLTFQGFPGDAAGEGERVGLRVVSWGGDADRLRSLRGGLEEALGRLVGLL